MADCNPPDPPPLLKEPYRKLPTAADQAEREDRYWGMRAVNLVTGDGWGCLVLIGLGGAAAAALTVLAETKQPG